MGPWLENPKAKLGRTRVPVGGGTPAAGGVSQGYSLRHPAGLAAASWAKPGLQRWQRSPCTLSLQTQRPVPGSQAEPGTVPSGSHSQAANGQETSQLRGAGPGEGTAGVFGVSLTQTGLGVAQLLPWVAEIAGSAALTVGALGVVLAVVTHAPAGTTAGPVQLGVKVARGRVTIAVTS